MSKVASSSDRQSAVRLLACLCAGSSPSNGEYGPDVDGVLRSQSRLQAMDFWMRNPDYLANELLDEWETTRSAEALELAKQILKSREPDLRKVPMIRYHFGAFEPIDNPLSILRQADLVRIRREGRPDQIKEHVYLLTLAGRETMEKLAAAAPELRWYRDRAVVVARIAREDGGAAFKARQYRQAEYAETPLGRAIRPITERVESRLAAIIEGGVA